jgi:serine/threonine protein kinase
LTFPGYDILEEIGRGGMGIVYRAYDRRREQVVALKTLQRMSPESLYRFKQEFRAHADLTHPNLASLYELIADGEQWFFTMELVEGVSFLSYVRSGHDLPANAPGTRSVKGSAAMNRLRGALRQLATGVAVLHWAGKLHRDLKPGNVLVTRSGRVVVLDFGLVADLNRVDALESTEGVLLGTVRYMAPEQAACRPVTPAADWYSVGAMLYEALTGRLPFEGSAARILQDKQRFDPPPPREVVRGLPDDLAILSADLLSRDPALRPSGDEVLRLLGDTPPATAAPASVAPTDSLLVGRDRHLAILAEAIGDVRQGKPRSIFLAGPSGTGKSALVRRFLDNLRDEGDTEVVEGQCYEQETVPYKAFDGVVDMLSRLLGRLPPAEREAVLPRDVPALLRVFPVLRRAIESRRGSDIADPQEVRRRAFAGLRELLARLGDRRPLVLCIDDLQWGDADSAVLLGELLRPPDPPVFLLLGCYRSEDRAVSPFLSKLNDLRVQLSSVVAWQELAVDPLAMDDARDLAAQLLGHAATATPLATDIARESSGNPFFVYELTQALQAGALTPGIVSLEQVLWERIERLPAEARAVLAVIALASRPLASTEAIRATGMNVDMLPTLATLKTRRLLRAVGPLGQEVLTSYHDRVRETIIDRLSAPLAQDIHLRIANTLKDSGREDPEVLAVHFESGGRPELARPYYAEAADRAYETLAFDHAARLYKRALELTDPNHEEARHLRPKVGAALANAGRGAEAACAYSAAAAGAPVVESLRLRKLAAIQFMVSGHIDEGMEVARAVLKDINLRMPSSPWRGMLSLLFRRARLRLRGIRFVQREPEEIASEELERIDTCWHVTRGLALVDPALGAYYLATALLLALRAGAPRQIAAILAAEGSFEATGGGGALRRGLRLIDTAEALIPAGKFPYETGMLLLCRGACKYYAGDWRSALELCDQAEVIFKERCTGAAWELGTAHTFSLWALTYLGETEILATRWSDLLREATNRGDRYAATNLSTYIMSIVRLAADAPADALRDLHEAMRQWSQKGYHVQHHNATLARVLIDIYQGDVRSAWEHSSLAYKAMRRSLLILVQHAKIDALQSRARSALALAMVSRDRNDLLRQASRDAKSLGKIPLLWPKAWCQLLQACIAHLQGHDDRARAGLAVAASHFDSLGMQLHAETARRRLGQLLGGQNGNALIVAADARMTSLGIRRPARIAAVFAPGFAE